MSDDNNGKVPKIENGSASQNESESAIGLNISVKTFVGTIALLLGILILVGILTHVIPQGSYEYVVEDGREVIVPGTYAVLADADPLPIWRWFTAPFEVLGTEKAPTAIMLMLFILFIGGSFMVLEKSGILNYLIFSIVDRFGEKKYTLLAVISLVCMLLGSTMGIFEETITLVPITIALAVMLKWDTLVGIGMSILAVGVGFSAATLNPFTIGITQTLAGVPIFSGFLFRIVVMVVAYLMLMAFLITYAKKIEKNPEKSLTHEADHSKRERYEAQFRGTFEKDAKVARGLIAFVGALGVVFLYIFVGFFVQGLSDYAMPVMAIGFAGGALLAAKIAGYKKIALTFLKGIGGIAPSILLILLAMGITHIMETGKIIDTILEFFFNQMSGMGPFVGIIMLFALILIMDFFVGSATAKAFLLIPIIIPLSDMMGITRQSAIQAFALGDGFTNMIYPTNVVLLITLGVAGVSYAKWIRWTWKIQLGLIALSVIVLLIAVKINFGPV